MKKKIIYLAFSLALIFQFPLFVSNADGPSPGRTGAPGESNCMESCHIGNPLNAPGGVLDFKK